MREKLGDRQTEMNDRVTRSVPAGTGHPEKNHGWGSSEGRKRAEVSSVDCGLG